jgi:hypothetical protein
MDHPVCDWCETAPAQGVLMSGCECCGTTVYAFVCRWCAEHHGDELRRGMSAQLNDECMASSLSMNWSQAEKRMPGASGS